MSNRPVYEQIISNLRESYDRAAEQRENMDLPAWKKEERAEFLSWVEREGKSSLLEIGAGTGRDSHFFQENGLTVSCIDLSPEMVRLCRAKGLLAQQMDFLNLKFAPESFDSVFAFDCLLHVPKAELATVLENVQKVLRPEGLLYYGVHGGKDSEGIWESDDSQPKRFFAFYTDRQIQAIVSRYFDLLYFKAVPIGAPDLHFQSMILRRK